MENFDMDKVDTYLYYMEFFMSVFTFKIFQYLYTNIYIFQERKLALEKEKLINQEKEKIVSDSRVSYYC